MAQFPCSKECNKKRRSRGFTLVEVLVATVILIIGLVAGAAVIGSTLGNTARSGYMTQAATLATEKLEDLNRYPPSDANVTVPNGTSVGSLAADTAGYYDEVYYSPAEGALVETSTSLDASNNTQYQTTTYTPDGHMSPASTSSTAPNTAGSIAFDRRWIIEQDQPVVGVRRVTVLVTLMNQSVQPPVTFQMSMVRP
ncbi:MAG: prepilin-type N-terminal cleavage/methylation domain-containing protein [Candidatus Acidiferrales bacterium]|jgi:Tfp pilus assembly protein PilV